MYSIPAGKFNEQIQADERRIYGRVVIDYTDPFKDEGVHVFSMTGSRYDDFLPQITDGKTLPSAKWASLDGAWELDGSWSIAPAEPTMQVGWWSDERSGLDGSFEFSPRVALSFAVPQVIDKLTVTGDALRGEWPRNFVIDFRDEDGGLMDFHVAVSDNENIHWEQEIEEPLPGVRVMELTIFRWSHPGRQAKIVEFYTALQEVYEGDSLISIQLLEEREVSGGSLPIGNISANEIEVKLNNLDRRFSAGNENSPLYGMLRANRRIRAWLGIDTYVEYRGGSE